MRNKYGNRKLNVGGMAFDSKHELHRWNELQLLEKIGAITDLRRQVKFVLIPAQYEAGTGVYKKGKNKGNPKAGKLIERECSYFADFAYLENGILVVEDAKGVRTKEYIIKRKLMLYVHGIRIREV